MEYLRDAQAEMVIAKLTKYATPQANHDNVYQSAEGLFRSVLERNGVEFFRMDATELRTHKKCFTLDDLETLEKIINIGMI